MQPQDSQTFESYLTVFDAVPQKWEDAREFLVERLKEISNAVNVREIGWYLDEELLSGKAFIPGINQQGNSTSLPFRTILRKVIDFGPLPNATIKSVPHGIIVDDNFTLIELSGAATNPTGLQSFGLGHAAVNPPNTVEVFLDANNVNIITGIDRSGYTRVFVIIEYMQEL